MSLCCSEGLRPLSVRDADDEQQSGGSRRGPSKRDSGETDFNRILGVLVGAVITAVIQSSSATTVMVVGFVNSGLMTLRQAVWIIMGANIRTTITGQLVALDIGTIAPLFAFRRIYAGIAFSKKRNVQNIGSIIAGLGVLFIGLGMMSDAMVPMRDSEVFVNALTSFSNPIIGIVVEAIFTAVIQSSSASVGILQALALSGLIGIFTVRFHTVRTEYQTS